MSIDMDALARDLCVQVNVWDSLAVIDDEDDLVAQLLPVVRPHIDGVLGELRRAEGHVRESADRAGVDPHALVDSAGRSVLAPLLIARAQALAALATMR